MKSKVYMTIEATGKQGRGKTTVLFFLEKQLVNNGWKFCEKVGEHSMRFSKIVKIETTISKVV